MFGSTCKHWEIEAIVIATGVHYFFGKVEHLVISTDGIVSVGDIFYFYILFFESCYFAVCLAVVLT